MIGKNEEAEKEQDQALKRFAESRSVLFQRSTLVVQGANFLMMHSLDEAQKRLENLLNRS